MARGAARKARAPGGSDSRGEELHDGVGGVHLVDEEVDAVDVGERGRERPRPLAVARGLVAAALPPPRRGQVVVALAEGDGVRDVVRVGVDVGPRDEAVPLVGALVAVDVVGGDAAEVVVGRRPVDARAGLDAREVREGIRFDGEGRRALAARGVGPHLDLEQLLEVLGVAPGHELRDGEGLLGLERPVLLHVKRRLEPRRRRGVDGPAAARLQARRQGRGGRGVLVEVGRGARVERPPGRNRLRGLGTERRDAGPGRPGAARVVVQWRGEHGPRRPRHHAARGHGGRGATQGGHVDAVASGFGATCINNMQFIVRI